jgi:hypothetical protein
MGTPVGVSRPGMAAPIRWAALRKLAARTALAGLAGLALMAGCGDRTDRRADEGALPPPAVADTTDPAVAEDPVARPPQKTVTVSMEGMDEELRLVRYDAPADFPFRFSTYIPEDMVAERWPSAEGDAVAFVAAFGGQRNEAAAMRVIAHREGATAVEVEEILRQLALDLGTELVASTEEPRFDWSVREYRSVPRRAQRDGPHGYVAVGRRGDRYYTVAVHYPPEYADGFAPRTHQILQEWRWLP